MGQLRVNRDRIGGEFRTLEALMAEANGPLRAILNILTNGILNVAKLKMEGLEHQYILRMYSLGTTASCNASVPE